MIADQAIFYNEGTKEKNCSTCIYRKPDKVCNLFGQISEDDTKVCGVYASGLTRKSNYFDQGVKG